MSMPGITVSYKEAATTAVARSQKGAAGLIVLDDGCASGAYVLLYETDIPKGLSAENQAFIKRCFVGGSEKPSRVLLYVLEKDASAVAEALEYFETASVAYLAGPPDSSAAPEEILEWVKAQRELGNAARAVLPHTKADCEGIINLTASGIVENGEEVDTASFASRIVGLLCGTPMTESITYKVLPELDSVEYISRADMETRMAAGELLLFADGGTVRVLSGVTSLENAKSVPADFKKIKVLETVDMISTDIQTTAKNTYIGRLMNSFDNKCVLLTAIAGYLEGLEAEGLLEAGTSTVAIDYDAQRAYLLEAGEDVATMTETEILKAKTGDKVFLAVTVQPLDAIEAISVSITM